VRTPPVERPLKKARSAPTEFFLHTDGGALLAESRSKVLRDCEVSQTGCLFFGSSLVHSRLKMLRS
jgi:hypothetical protein